jgi:hypothetical protein
VSASLVQGILDEIETIDADLSASGWCTLTSRFVGRELGAGDERFELGPDELRMNPAAEATIRAGGGVRLSNAAVHGGIWRSPGTPVVPVDVED